MMMSIVSLRSQHDQCGYDTTVDLGTQMGVIVPFNACDFDCY